MSNNRDRRNQRESQGQGNQPQQSQQQVQAPQQQVQASDVPVPTPVPTVQITGPLVTFAGNQPTGYAQAGGETKKEEKKSGFSLLNLIWIIPVLAIALWIFSGVMVKGVLPMYGVCLHGCGENQQPAGYNSPRTSAPEQRSQATSEQGVVGYRVVAPTSTDVVAQNVDGRQMTIPAGKSHTFSCGPNNPRLSIHFFAANGGRCLGQIDYRYNSGDGLRERFL